MAALARCLSRNQISLKRSKAFSVIIQPSAAAYFSLTISKQFQGAFALFPIGPGPLSNYPLRQKTNVQPNNMHPHEDIITSHITYITRKDSDMLPTKTAVLAPPSVTRWHSRSISQFNAISPPVTVTVVGCEQSVLILGESSPQITAVCNHKRSAANAGFQKRNLRLTGLANAWLFVFSIGLAVLLVGLAIYAALASYRNRLLKRRQAKAAISSPPSRQAPRTDDTTAQYRNRSHVDGAEEEIELGSIERAPNQNEGSPRLCNGQI